MPPIKTPSIESPRPQPTGRQLVMFAPGVEFADLRRDLQNASGIVALSAQEATGAGALDNALDQGHAVVFDRFNMAVIGPPAMTGDKLMALQASNSVISTRPEFYMYAIADLEGQYAEWVRTGLSLLSNGLAPAWTPGAEMIPNGRDNSWFADTDECTWGLSAVGANRSGYTGKGVRVAVLDTGLDVGHPDFAGRPIVPRSFVSGEDVHDVQGHGTHTAGTIAGPAKSRIGRRYGVAPDVDLYIGKVLGNNGSGREADIINGISWAISQKCAVISMSLGRPTMVGEKPDPLYEVIGAAALKEGSLIVAAAGNESRREFNHIAPVCAPANSPSILAVAAIDARLSVASFSCGGVNDEGGEIDISGPGVSVYSSVPRPQLSKLLPGTSMACPHVAGVAALWVQAQPGLRSQELWRRLTRSARDLSPARDFGSGLVQAPASTV